MTEPTVVTDRAAFRAVAAEAPAGARVPVELRTAVADPFEAYRRARDGAGGVFLETTGGRAGWGYFAVDPVERLQVSADVVLADRDAPGHGDFARPSPSLAALDGLLSGETLVRGDCDVPYPCGAFGWLSYDVARELESLPDGTVDDRHLPHLQVGVYDCVAAGEEPREEDGETTLRITCCPRVEADADLDAVYDEALARATALAEAATTGDVGACVPPVEVPEAEFVSDCGRTDYAERVRRVKAYIRAGDTFQANIAQRLVAPAAVHPVDAYAALRRVNPAPYSGLMEFSGAGWAGGIDLVSASPELLLDRDGDRLVTEPIAGTRPRGATPEEDEALEADLTVTDYRRVDRYSEVMHLVSVVEGRMREGVTLADAVAATFPGGTITGAPKPRTMEIIDELEATRRGPYTGSMAVFGFDGRATLNIVIRTLVRLGDEYHLRVGAGIVHDSDPDREYDETLAKGRALVNAIDEALGELAEMRVGEAEAP